MRPSSRAALDARRQYEEVLEQMKQDLKCAICMGPLKRTRTVMECLHRFCRDCIEKSMRQKNECPSCRTPLKSRRDLREDFRLDSIVQSVFPDMEKYEEEEMAMLQEVAFRTPAPPLMRPKRELGEKGESPPGQSGGGLEGREAHTPGLAPSPRSAAQMLELGKVKKHKQLVVVELQPLPSSSDPPLEHPHLACPETMLVESLCAFLREKLPEGGSELLAVHMEEMQGGEGSPQRPTKKRKAEFKRLAGALSLGEVCQTWQGKGNLVLWYGEHELAASASEDASGGSDS